MFMPDKSVNNKKERAIRRALFSCLITELMSQYKLDDPLWTKQ